MHRLQELPAAPPGDLPPRVDLAPGERERYSLSDLVFDCPESACSVKGTGILQRDPDILMLDVEVNGERVALVRSAGGERNRWPAIDGDLRELDPF